MTRTVKYFSYRGNHTNGKDSTSCQAITPAMCSRVLSLAADAKERGEKEIVLADHSKVTLMGGNSGGRLVIPMPRIKVIARDDFGIKYEITMSDKSWRKLGAHV